MQQNKNKKWHNVSLHRTHRQIVATDAAKLIRLIQQYNHIETMQRKQQTTGHGNARDVVYLNKGHHSGVSRNSGGDGKANKWHDQACNNSIR